MKASGSKTNPDKFSMESSILQRSALQPLGVGAEGKENNNFARPKMFFRSSNLEVRMVSSFIILKTLHQGLFPNKVLNAPV